MRRLSCASVVHVNDLAVESELSRSRTDVRNTVLSPCTFLIHSSLHPDINILPGRATMHGF